VETNQRIAEFKFGRWTGSDAARKREICKDLVNLASDDSAELQSFTPSAQGFQIPPNNHL
jgi:hypothetical protein